MDFKDSWIKKNITPTMVFCSAPQYLAPSMMGVVSSSIRMGWEHKYEAEDALQKHLLESKALGGFDPETKFDFKIVRIIIAEEDCT